MNADEHPGADDGWAAELHRMRDELGQPGTVRPEPEPAEVELPDTGRHHIDTVQPVPADWNPLSPADRQALAPTWWANRTLHANPDQRTGWFNPADLDALEVTR